MNFFITYEEEEEEARKLKNTHRVFLTTCHKVIKLVLSTWYLLERVTSSGAANGPKGRRPKERKNFKKESKGQ
jgi:hypothetical protein